MTTTGWMTTTNTEGLEARTLAIRCLAASAGAALGALARWALTSQAPAAGTSFPWATFGVNVLGCALLALLPLLPLTRRTSWMPVFLGTGVLGGFTTMSTASYETFALLDHGAVATALAYGLGTLGAALLAVLAVDRVTTTSTRQTAARQDFELQEGDE